MFFFNYAVKRFESLKVLYKFHIIIMYVIQNTHSHTQVNINKWLWVWSIFDSTHH